MDEAILLRFLTKESTPEDLHIIDQWIAANRENGKWLFEMEEIWSLKTGLKYSDEAEIRRAYMSFLTKTTHRHIGTGKREVSFLIRIAAAVAVAVVLILLSITALESFHDDSVLYDLTENIDVNEINVPNGQSISLKLADGTKVWLNSGSQLVYPAKFSSKNRMLKLTGEGFFDVEHNKKSPFVVMSGSVRTKVLGTKFNVKAYENETIRISLLEGIIEVSADEEKEVTRLSEPDQQIEIFANGAIKKNNVNSFAVSKWTDGELYFENETLESIATTLERKFKVKVTIRNDAYRNMVFNSRIQKGALLEDILNVLKGTREIDYSIEEGNVYIY